MAFLAVKSLLAAVVILISLSSATAEDNTAPGFQARQSQPLWPVLSHLSRNNGMDVSGLLFSRNQQYCPLGTSLCPTSGRCCEEPADACCDNGACIVKATDTCCSGGGVCNNGQECCPNGCAPRGATCCRGNHYCDAGYLCCPNTSGCAPPGAQCCNDGGYCPRGQYCVIIRGRKGCCDGPDCSGSSNPPPTAPGSPSFETTATPASPGAATSSPSFYQSAYYTEITYTYFVYWYIVVYISIDATSTSQTVSLTSSRTTASSSVSVSATDSFDADASFSSMKTSLQESASSSVLNEGSTPISGSVTVAATSFAIPHAGGAAGSSPTEIAGGFSSAPKTRGTVGIGIWIPFLLPLLLSLL